MRVLPVYAALFAFFFVALSLRTVRLRSSLRIAVGDSGNERMLRAMRVHANFAEYVPLSLLLIFLVEVQGASLLLVHGLCLCLLVGRILHAFGVSQTKEDYRYRVAGMALTFVTLGTAAAYLLVDYLRHWGA